jgi:hypothetical protein
LKTKKKKKIGKNHKYLNAYGFFTQKLGGIWKAFLVTRSIWKIFSLLKKKSKKNSKKNTPTTQLGAKILMSWVG